MMRITILLALLVPAGHAVSADTDVIAKGKMVFQQVCAPCHGAGPGLDGSKMLPGTAVLAARYQGVVPAPLEDRPGLNYEFLNQVVRNGQGAMPMFRKTEISDAELKAVSVYLMQNNKMNN